MYADLVTAAAFLLIAGVIYAFGDALVRGRKPDRERSAKLFRTPTPASAALPPRSAFFANLEALLAKSVPQMESELQGIAQDLKRAGIYAPGSLNAYLSSRNLVLLLILAATCGFAWTVRQQPGLLRATVMVGGAVMIIAYGIPRVMLRLQANARVQRIQRALPDALDIVTMCMTGGLPLQQALSQVVEELQHPYPDVATEFNIVRQQSDAGSMTHALREFAGRIDAPDVRSLSALIAQSERLGTNIAIALQDYSDSMRRGMRQRAEERASTASIKLLFPVILCLAPPVYILMCGPAVVELRNFVIRENKPGGLLTGTGAAIAAQRALQNAQGGNSGDPAAPDPASVSNNLILR